MDKYVKLLDEFRTATGDKPVVFVPNHPAAQLQSRLIEEEAVEVLDALALQTEEQLLKELCDLLYVTFDTAWKYDLPIWQAFQEVHKNNLLKTEYPRNEYGKIIKPANHPKVNLRNLIQEYRDDGA